MNEIILCDTGSHDNTIELAKNRGAKIKEFKWKNDFSEARNYAISHSSGTHNLIIDADEWLIKGGETLINANKEIYDQVGKVKIISTFQQEGRIERAVDWSSRLLPKQVRYAGKFHEQPVHHLPVYNTSLSIGHDGYMKEQMSAKNARNHSLLESCLNSEPNDPYLNFQMGKLYEVNRAFQNASYYYEIALRFCSNTAPFWSELYCRSIYVAKKARNFNLMQERLSDKNHPCTVDYYFTKADAMLDLAIETPENAGKILPIIESCLKLCLEIGDDGSNTGSVIGRGSFLAAENLFAYYSALGDAKAANQFKSLADETRRKILIDI